MANWHEILYEIKEAGSTFDVIRRKYLKKLYRMSGRNIIIYYSGWLQKRGHPDTYLNDSDKNGFMAVINKLNHSKGLDLILHTPGGDAAATESLVDYLHSMFGNNIRTIVPQLALSAGTMIACASKEIIMGKHSSLGPIDPQLGGMPAHGIVEEFKRAFSEVQGDPSKVPIWQVIISKYQPTLIGECEKAIEWANEMVKEWLLNGMLQDVQNAERQADIIIAELGDHALTKSHNRHISFSKCKSFGMNVSALEDNQKIQDAVLSVHHSCIHTFSSTPALKIIENHNGIAFIQNEAVVMMPQK